MAIRSGQSELGAWFDMARCHRDEEDTDGENEEGLCRGREDLAVDVMTIVGKILWGAPAPFIFEAQS